MISYSMTVFPLTEAKAKSLEIIRRVIALQTPVWFEDKRAGGVYVGITHEDQKTEHDPVTPGEFKDRFSELITAVAAYQTSILIVGKYGKVWLTFNPRETHPMHKYRK